MKLLNTYKIVFIIILIGLFIDLNAQSTEENYVKVTEFLTENGENGDKIEYITYFDGIGRELQQLLIKGTNTNKDIVIHHSYDPITGRKTKDYLPAPTNQNNGNIISNPIQLIYNYYNEKFGESIYYSEKKLDFQSVGSRVLQQGFPGDDWELDGGNDIKYSYHTNAANEIKRFYGTNSDLNPDLVDLGYYKKGELKKIITRDEQNSSNTNSHSIETFIDRSGKTILIRKYGKVGSSTIIEKFDTYFVYDIDDNLTYIIPPLVNTLDGVSSNEQQLITKYVYDNKNRIIEKKLPEQGTIQYVYDNQNRLVASQDQKQRQAGNGEWTFYKYDKFGRLVISGLVWDSGNREQIQNHININFGVNNAEFYTSGYLHDNITIFYKPNMGYPVSGYQILSVNYYDKYSGLSQAEISKPTIVEGQTIRSDDNSLTHNLRGLPTSSTNRILGTWLWEHNYTFYDTKVRPVRTHKTFSTLNGEKGYTKIDSEFEAFKGKTIFTKTEHKKGTQPTILIQQNYGYNNKDILTSITQSVNGGPLERISTFKYDLLGNIEYKNVGNPISQSPLQKIDYFFNIRGWLTGINEIDNELGLKIPPAGDALGDIFALKLQYNELIYEGLGEVPKLYNGNISQQLWRTASDNTIRGYIYHYDELNRLKEANYHKPNSTIPFPGNFDEIITYDKNGNIQTLQRFAGYDNASYFEMIDNLSYTYGLNSGGAYFTNKVNKITDGTNSSKGFSNGNSGTSIDYSYDSNGNLISDLNKNITSIDYNYLNLPTKIKWNNSESKKIEYFYSSTGQKIQKKITNGSQIFITDYLDGFQYFNGKLEFFPHQEGYVKHTLLNNQSTFDYVYNYTDHLGNVRLSYAKDPSTSDLKILTENHYYPFGLKHQKYINPALRNIESTLDQSSKAIIDINPQDETKSIYSNYDYKYNYQEWQDEFGLNWYAMDFRNYDPAIGRFHSADPLGELTPDWTPYRFAFNNPVYFSDPTGLCEDCEGDFVELYYSGWDSTNSDIWNIFNLNWGVDINFDTLASGEWNESDMFDNFAAEEYTFEMGENDNGYQQNDERLNNNQNPSPTISNKSDYPIFILDENYHEIHVLLPNSDYFKKFDGIAMPHLNTSEILKVVNGNSVVVNNHNYNVKGKNLAYSLIQLTIGGLKDKNWLIKITSTENVFVGPDIGNVEIGKEKADFAKKHWAPLFEVLGIKL